MASQKNSNHDEKAKRINELFQRIIEIGYEKGFDHVQPEIKEVIQSMFGDRENRNDKGIVEIFLLALNYQYGRPLSDYALKDILNDTALIFIRKLKNHEIDLKKCHGNVLSFILGIAKYKYLEEFRKQEGKIEKSLEDIKNSETPKVKERDPKELRFWKSKLEKFSDDKIRLLVLRLLKGLPHREIAQAMNCTEAAGRRRWNRIKNRLTKIAYEHDLIIWSSGLYEAVVEVAESRKIKFPCESGMIVTYDEVKETIPYLPPLYRRVMYLKFFEELNDEDLAKRMGCSIKRCYDLIRRAKIILSYMFRSERE